MKRTNFMRTLVETLDQSLFTPVRGLKKRYLPLLLIYAAYGAQGLTTIALSFWEKESLSLSAEQLVALGVWLSLPWTIKMIFGQLVDGVTLFGSRRRVYVFIGAGLMTLGYLMLWGMAIGHPLVSMLGSEFNQYLAVMLVSVLGFVLQDVTADAMSTEVVDRTQSETEIKKELALVQVLGRLSLMLSMTLVAGLGGWLAQNFEYSIVFLLALGIPVLSVIGAIFVRPQTDLTPGKLSPLILGGGLGFGVLTVGLGFSGFAYGQEIVALVSAGLLLFMLRELLKNQKKTVIKTIALTFTALFVFRAMPSVGPGYNWWAIDVLGFDPAFFGILAQTGALVSLVTLWLLASFVASRPAKTVLWILIGLGLVFSLPNLMLYYGLHETLGWSARTVALFDTALDSPLVHISMIPMLSLIAFYAPAGSRATWFAVSASLMNLALTTGAIASKYLNKLFVVSREVLDEAGNVVVVADYSQLGLLLWSVILLALVLPSVAVWFGLERKSTKS